MILQIGSMIPQTTPVTLHIRLMILQMTPMIPQIAPSDNPAGEQRSFSGASAAKLSRRLEITGRPHRIALDEAVEEGRKRFNDATVAPT